ncbi:MAG: WYL domain-containing protein, partial [Clostridia bacterium]|nr:WYL domain-containing protein [Clostridia bacterium]
MNESGRKLKILYLLQVLYKKSDENDPVSVETIISELAKYNISAERKSIYSDIAALREFGIEIETVKSKSVGYYIKNKVLTDDDISSLWDAVHAAEFISPKQCDQLKKKIEALIGDKEKNRVRRRVYTVNRALRQPEIFTKNLNMVHAAIAEKKQISFVYDDAVTIGRRVKKTTYCASPYIVI